MPGTQAVSVAVRGFSVVDVSLGKLVRDELAIGVIVGLVMGGLAALPVFFLFDDGWLAMAVGLAVLGAGTVSSTVGFGLPWMFQRFGLDPALGSGPICTIIQDRASLAIYFALVTAIYL
jgi:magnesium transporter